MEGDKKEKTTIASSGVNVSSIFIILTVAALIVAVVFWGISLTRKYQASSTEKKLATVEEETSAMGNVNEKAQQLYAAEQNLGEINSTKNYWSKFLADLANQTTKNVSLTELAFDVEGKASISGTTVSYEALAKFMSSLRASGNYDEVSLSSATLSTEGGGAPITFSVSITPKATILSK